MGWITKNGRHIFIGPRPRRRTTGYRLPRRISSSSLLKLHLKARTRTRLDGMKRVGVALTEQNPIIGAAATAKELGAGGYQVLSGRRPKVRVGRKVIKL